VTEASIPAWLGRTLSKGVLVLALLALGASIGWRWGFDREAHPSLSTGGLSAATLERYIEESFGITLDEALREAGSFDDPGVPDSFRILLVRQGCAPSARALEVLRNAPADLPLFVLATEVDDSWLLQAYPDVERAPPGMADGLRGSIPVMVTPTTIEVRFRTVTRFRLGLAPAIERITE
jgi:hypothetical protein